MTMQISLYSIWIIGVIADFFWCASAGRKRQCVRKNRSSSSGLQNLIFLNSVILRKTFGKSVKSGTNLGIRGLCSLPRPINDLSVPWVWKSGTNVRFGITDNHCVSVRRINKRKEKTITLSFSVGERPTIHIREKKTKIK